MCVSVCMFSQGLYGAVLANFLSQPNLNVKKKQANKKNSQIDVTLSKLLNYTYGFIIVGVSYKMVGYSFKKL